MKLKLLLKVFFFAILLFSVFSINAQTCNGNTFTSPGAPATCTYSYTATGWEDQFGNPTTKPTSDILASESVCILADNAEALLNGGGSPKFNGTFYVAPGVTFSGSIPDFENATIVVEGTLNLSNLPDITDSSIYIDTTGTWNATGDFIIQQTSFLYNAGDINVGGNVELGGGSLNYNYPNANFIVSGAGNFNVNSPFFNCGLLETGTGELKAGGGSSLTNLCTTYVNGDFQTNGNYTNEGLLIVDGNMIFNGYDVINDDTILANNIILNSNNLIGDGINSTLIVRNNAQLIGDTGPASITGHFYFDMDDGGGFDSVCVSCTEDISILPNVTVPTDPAILRADCGINIIVEYPFCKIVDGNNTIYGYVFGDYNRNASFDPDEPVEESVTVNLYSDLNSNGIIDGADSIVQTTTTNASGEYTFGISPVILTNQVFSNRVDRDTDDASQFQNDNMVLYDVGLDMEDEDPYTGVRVNNITIPQNATINSAVVKFICNESDGNPSNYEISAQKSSNATTFIDVEKNLSNRWDETNKVSWPNIPAWTVNNEYASSDISSVVQDIVNRYTWAPGNSMAIIFKYLSGIGERESVSHDNDPARAPLLEINYDGAEPASYIVQIDLASLPATYTLTTTNYYSIAFDGNNAISCDNNFGFTSPCNDPTGADTDGDGVQDLCDQDDDNDGILDVDECLDLGKPQILNSDFEYVNIVSSGLDNGPTDSAGSFNGIWKGDTSHLPNWESVHTDNILEIWQNGHNLADDAGGTAYTGIQWSEVNISTNDGFYQDITTTPGDLLQWSFAHRKRLTYAGSGTEDVVRLLIGDPVGPLVSHGDFSSANDATWTLHTGTYTVPVGQTTTRLQLTAINTVSGSLVAGNFIDNVQFYVIPNCENTDGDAYEDYLDIDSDDDGIPDNVEAQATLEYVPPVGPVNSTSGLYPEYSGGLTLIDTDGDGIYDFRDSDSDSDGTPDIEENGMANVAGITDSDNDGLKDVFETNGVSDASWDVNEDIEDPTDLSILPDDDNDRFLGGDLNYRDLLDTNLPAIAKIDFDGVDDYLEIPVSPLNTMNEFTFGFWMKLDETLTNPHPAKTFVIGQKDMFEINVGNNTDGKPYVWTTHFYGAGPSEQSAGHQIDNINWVHITVVSNYNTELMKIYINGEELAGLNISGNSRLTNSNPFRIGSKRDVQPDPDQENFKGWIDEVKIFGGSLTTDQIQQMVYQEIGDNAGTTHGVTIDKDIEDTTTNASIPWNSLIGYYPMDYIVNNYVKDQSLYKNNARLFNITTVEPQNAPMPYETVADGPWTTEGTWLHGDVWDIEDIPNNKDWSIVHIHDNVTTSASHTQLGLLIDTDKTLSVSGDNEIRNTWYLQLDGTLDLADDSQLVQTETSDLVTSAAGKILRRQEGNANKYWYNYWSSSVGALSATTLNNNNGPINNINNTPYSLKTIKDGGGSTLQFTDDFDEVGKVSRKWLYNFQNGVTFWDWNLIDENTAITPGLGYTQKGTGNAGLEQQYTFEGKPNNGTIILNAVDTGGPGSVEDVSLTTYLVGNPYPSALDARAFITDNASTIGGTILLWEQWAGDTHLLAEYEGGYGYINSMTTSRAYQYPGIPIADQSQTQGIKTPTFYIPVGQGFFVEIENDGPIEFNNGQRIFKQEALNESIFFGIEGAASAEPPETNRTAEYAADGFELIRLEFATSQGATRHFVLGFNENTTDDFDYGFDGGKISTAPEEDMGSILNGEQYVLQAFAPITPTKEIDLYLKTSGTLNYSIKIDELINIDPSQELFLRDNQENIIWDLRSGAYNFTTTGGVDTDRFDFVFQDQGALSNDEFDNDQVVIFVNNSQDKLFVKGLTEQVTSLTLTNMLGQTIKTYDKPNVTSLENGVYVGDLSSGVYLVNLLDENNLEINKKIILE